MRNSRTIIFILMSAIFLFACGAETENEKENVETSKTGCYIPECWVLETSPDLTEWEWSENKLTCERRKNECFKGISFVLPTCEDVRLICDFIVLGRRYGFSEIERIEKCVIPFEECENENGGE